MHGGEGSNYSTFCTFPALIVTNTRCRKNHRKWRLSRDEFVNEGGGGGWRESVITRKMSGFTTASGSCMFFKGGFQGKCHVVTLHSLYRADAVPLGFRDLEASCKWRSIRVPRGNRWPLLTYNTENLRPWKWCSRLILTHMQHEDLLLFVTRVNYTVHYKNPMPRLSDTSARNPCIFPWLPTIELCW